MSIDRIQYVVQHQAGVYFGLVESHLAEIWEILPDERPIMVTRYCGIYGEQGTTMEYRKGYFKKPEKKSLDEIQSLLISIQNEEDSMSITADLLKVVNAGGAEAFEKALQERVKVMIRRCAKQAEENCEFVAMAAIATVQEKYGTPVQAGQVLDTKESKEIKLQKSKEVPGPVWDAILGKASKLGFIMSNSGDKAVIRIRNEQAKVFEKAVAAVKGITIG